MYIVVDVARCTSRPPEGDDLAFAPFAFIIVRSANRSAGAPGRSRNEAARRRYSSDVLLLRSALLRSCVPLVIMGVMGVALLLEGDMSNARGAFAVGVIVGAVSGASVVYSVDRWTLPVQSGVHFGIMVCTVLPALFLSGWFALDSSHAYLAVIGMFLASGVVLWLTFYVVFGVILARRSQAPGLEGGS